jgi:predicted MFS family arabinose efflux permease
VRVTSLLVTGSDFTLNALYLVVIVLAQQRGASAALVGSLFAFLGVGGLLGALAAPWLARRLRTRTIVLATQWTVAVLVPLLIVVPGRLSPGVLYGAMLFFHPTWNATVGAYRMKLAPTRCTDVSRASPPCSHSALFRSPPWQPAYSSKPLARHQRSSPSPA